MNKVLVPLTCLGLTLLSWSSPGHAIDADDTKSDVSQYLDLSLEALLDQKVTSANKRPQSLSDVAAAAYVISTDDIRASGAKSLPEVLRLAPGVDVARISADRWAVSIRGFTGFFANKLLVLVDGRSAFSPSFNGVLWNSMQFPLENIERIEVIRGPGGSVWGVNAVNGVINIITKSSRDTQGTQILMGAGSELRTFAQARHGGMLGKDATFSVYAKGEKGDDSTQLSGESAHDGYDHQSAGFRMDRDTGDDVWQLTGDLYHQHSKGMSVIPDPSAPLSGYWRTETYTNRLSGGNLQARFTRRLGPSSTLAAQLSWSHNVADLSVLACLQQDVVDAELQHTFRLGARHDVTWGLAYRWYRDDATAGPTANFVHERETLRVASLFGQDEYALTEHLRLTLGARLDYQKYTGSEFQPSLSLLWNLDARRSLWASVARATRIPSRGERTGAVSVDVIPPPALGPLPVLTVVRGNARIDAEKMNSIELGYRGQETEKLFVDVTAYIHDYKDLITTAGPDFPGLQMHSGYLVLPVNFDNVGALTSRGIELATSWQLNPAWRVRGTYTYSTVDGSRAEVALGNPPKHILSVLSSWRIDEHTDVDLWLRHVAKRNGVANLPVDAYTTADLRLAWRPVRGVEVSLVGQNLLEARHEEFTSTLPTVVPTQVQRGVYGQIKLDF